MHGALPLITASVPCELCLRWCTVCSWEILAASDVAQSYITHAGGAIGSAQHLLFVVAQCLGALVRAGVVALLGGHQVLSLNIRDLSFSSFANTYLLLQSAWTHHAVLAAVQPLAESHIISLQPALIRYPSGARRGKGKRPAQRGATTAPKAKVVKKGAFYLHQSFQRFRKPRRGTGFVLRHVWFF